MAFYENTLVVRQDLPKAELDKIKNKYNELIKNNSGKVVKIEEWGLIDFADKIKNFNKGFFIHFKFENDGMYLETGSLKSMRFFSSKINMPIVVTTLLVDHNAKMVSLFIFLSYFLFVFSLCR